MNPGPLFGGFDMVVSEEDVGFAMVAGGDESGDAAQCLGGGSDGVDPNAGRELQVADRNHFGGSAKVTGGNGRMIEPKTEAEVEG